MHAHDLDGLSRSDLIERAESLGVEKAGLFTRAELLDEIVRRMVSDPVERRVARGLLGVARDLVARVVERGLHLPDAAARIRGTSQRPTSPPGKPPIATVTLAEIYATQGHRSRALAVLDEVLAEEEDHAAARELREKIADANDEPVLPPEPDEPAEPAGEAPQPSASSSSSSDVASSPSDAISSAASGGDGPLGMLDDAPLPDKYDVDEVVLMPVDPKTVFVYWEVRQTTLEQAHARAEGRLVLRVVAVTAKWTGPIVETRDIEIEQLVGDWFVRDLPLGAVVRAAVGWRAAEFEPLAVAMETSAPPAAPALSGASELVRFTAEGLFTIESAGPDDELVTAAVERARRRVALSRELDRYGSSSWPAVPFAPSSAAPAVTYPMA